MKNIIIHPHKVKRNDREKIKNQKGCVIWLTGLSGSGKSTIANELEYELNKMKYHTYLLDGDNIRSGLNSDLSFNENDRKENIRRISEVAKLFVDSGIITITAFISPFIKDREKAKKIIGVENFIEVFIDTPLEECIKRDPKGLYKKALDGKIKNFTGIDQKYEKPINPNIHIDTIKEDLNISINKIINYLDKKGYINVKQY
ncbi:adenylyl-sulfate kinase [Caminibacter mediatlanticus TB-2]|uniref:Adenylyl-sulfate kinase n=1 Tax=Caminibacter mediatlanticus TB-2 TaxID=391592 RepID=A0ABX5VAV2_9BACT|nr:adenylyl-sulfate kinase [Caminibacter mediatlanticus]QCT94709.1 adenylyl-sulfate kinase [Caminibacter mediatlanticus TB-2]